MPSSSPQVTRRPVQGGRRCAAGRPPRVLFVRLGAGPGTARTGLPWAIKKTKSDSHSVSHLIRGMVARREIRAGAGRGGLGALPRGGWGVCCRAGWGR